MGGLLVNREPEQLDLLGAGATVCEVTKASAAGRKRPCPGSELKINLGIVGQRLRTLSQRQQVPMAALIRRAVMRMLDEELPAAPVAAPRFDHSAANAQIHLRLPPAAAMTLITRAHAADMTRGEYVWSLLAGMSPPALSADHGQAIRALLTSTDGLAVLAEDLRAFLSLLGKASRPELDRYKASVRSLDGDVREHLKVASVLLAELRPYRRPRK